MVILISGCAENPGINTQPRTEPVPSISMGDSLWGLRLDASTAQAALDCYQSLAANDPFSIEKWSKLSRTYYFIGQYLTSDPAKRDSLFMRGYEASQSILTRNQDYHNLLYSTGDENVAIRGLDETYLDALYWGMANYGQWLVTKGDLVRLGQREVIWSTLEHVNDLDSAYYYGAYFRFKGALLSRDPKLQKDTTSIRNAFERAREIAPQYLGNNTLMAEFYCPLSGDKDLFYQLLNEVLVASGDTDLPYYPENFLERSMAERLMIKAEKEAWFQL